MKFRGELLSLETQKDRPPFFDFLQLEVGRIRGLKPKFNLYSEPGQVIYACKRKLVLERADGVIFVADSQPERLCENLDLLADPGSHLAGIGYRSSGFPLIMRCNKEGLPGEHTPETLRQHLCGEGVPCIGAVATQGIGVFATLKLAINLAGYGESSASCGRNRSGSGASLWR